ncbi:MULTISPECIES: hypothetical protein [Priestia]|uniref:hypothetical protein n=1 Tax=Priestia TaxID=2800373 RepID=UPI00064FE073|nr:hypothetical protein [Priestia aryabhattai]KML28463.1 hypothetical protein VL11_17235 [Priestia aryabhattai]KMN98666.1 hypothetical protein ABV89_16355 [Priestia aryabhattai]NLR44900.1 hypothetical protein [Priestia megaterium]
MFFFLDKHHDKLTWMIVGIGLILFFLRRDMLTFVLTLYICLQGIQHRRLIKKKIKATSWGKRILYVLCFLLLIVVLAYSTTHMLAWAHTHHVFIVFQFIMIYLLILLGRFLLSHVIPKVMNKLHE